MGRIAFAGCIVVAGCIALAGCNGDRRYAERDAARHLIAQNCAGCHRVPGVREARGRVGPSLDGIGAQQIIAGHFANNPQMLSRWIEHPQQLLPGNAMPETGLSPEQARLITNYLYTLD